MLKAAEVIFNETSTDNGESTSESSSSKNNNNDNDKNEENPGSNGRPKAVHLAVL